jgi:Methylamine utilisation protein MauE
VAAALLLTYAIAISINLRAGRELVACGCGGPDQRRPIAGWMVWRNLLLALGLGLATLPWSARKLEWTDGATLAFGLTSIALLYSCAERLLGDLGRTRDSGMPSTS